MAKRRKVVRRKKYVVEWKVDGELFHESFTTRAKAFKREDELWAEHAIDASTSYQLKASSTK